MRCVAAADNGEKAIHLVDKYLPDVAVIDVAMPKVNGIEVANFIKTNHPSIAVLMVSAYKYRYYIIACMRAKVNGYLLKGTRKEDFTNAIRMVYSGETVFDKEIIGEIQNSIGAGEKRHELLGGRELQVLKLVAAGLGNKEIADRLKISTNTVGSHLIHIFRKLDVNSRTKAILYAVKEGWIKIDEFSIIEKRIN